MSSVAVLATATIQPVVYANEVTTPNVMQSTPNEKLATRFHKVQGGDTLFSISKKYGVTVEQVKQWNGLSDNVIKVNQYLGVDGVSRTREPYKSTQEFIQAILPDAIKLAKEYNIYTSIMMAQAIHETGGGNSDKTLLANNIFGIKAISDNYVWLPTWEVINGKRVDIIDKFERYDSFYDSMVSNAQKLRYGLSWNPLFYQGTWVENTASHMDVAEYLTGRYATDPLYASKLINTIRTYNLTQYDYHVAIEDPVISQRNIQYIGTVGKANMPIYTQPYGTASDVLVGNTNQYMGKEVLVTQEKVNGAGTWVKMTIDGTQIGFAKKEALTNIVIITSI